MTCNPCSEVADLKAVYKDILHTVDPNSLLAYNTLKFTEIDTEGGKSTWRHLLIQTTVANASHRRLRNILLYQLDNFLSSGPPLNIAPWHEPPYNIHDLSANLPHPMEERATVMSQLSLRADGLPYSPPRNNSDGSPLLLQRTLPLPTTSAPTQTLKPTRSISPSTYKKTTQVLSHHPCREKHSQLPKPYLLSVH
jgi:hypothetical protein